MIPTIAILISASPTIPTRKRSGCSASANSVVRFDVHRSPAQCGGRLSGQSSFSSSRRGESGRFCFRTGSKQPVVVYTSYKRRYFLEGERAGNGRYGCGTPASLRVDFGAIPQKCGRPLSCFCVRISSHGSWAGLICSFLLVARN
jgi:hypothetical protein